MINIFKGWFSWIFEKPFNQKVVDARVKACELCPHSKPVKYPARNDEGKFVWAKGLKCSICKCPCEPKARVKNEKCPVGRWPQL